MTINLLLDLDDTLLKNNFDDFLPNYLEAFSQTVAPIVEPGRFVKALLNSTRDMFDNRQPDCTLLEVFEASFFPPLGIDKEEFSAYADNFYSDVFPKLKGLTKPKPEAVKLVNQALERGFTITISTNPLFPITAIEQRLNWANLSPSDYQYELVSSYEEFHFAKPNPAFFAEVLAQMGWPVGQVVVVGDDLERDIDAARKLGLATFWVNPNEDGKSENKIVSEPSGKLSELMAWLENSPPEELEPDFSTPEALLAILRSTPAALDTLCGDMSSSDWGSRPVHKEWSMTEVICHLRDVDREVNLARIKQLRQKNNPFISGIDTDKWANERKYNEQDGKFALEEFIAVRIELLDMLENLLQDEWLLAARHAIFGPTNLTEMVGIIASHDRLHVHQVNQLIKMNSGSIQTNQ